MVQSDELLTAAGAAEYLGVCVGRLYQLRSAGGGPTSWREHGRLVYPRSQLDAYRARIRQETMRGAVTV